MTDAAVEVAFDMGILRGLEMTVGEAARFRQDLGKRMVGAAPGYTILPLAEGALLADCALLAESRKMPDGTDEVNMVSVTIRADIARPVPADMQRKILDVVRECWPQTEGWERQ